jgi:hypothetical protein
VELVNLGTLHHAGQAIKAALRLPGRGTFDSIEHAKQAGKERHSVSFEEWRVGDYLDFQKNLGRAEVHTPEIDGKVIRHDIRWK